MKESPVKFATNTALPPCCLRIFRDKYILVGTYELDKLTGNRTGSIEVYDSELKLLHSYPTYGAILDLKLSPFDPRLVATAHSTGNISLWKISEGDGEGEGGNDNNNNNHDNDSNNDDIQLTLVRDLFVFDPDVLLSSLHFSPLDPQILCVTTTQGETALVHLETNICSWFNARDVNGTKEHQQQQQQRADVISREVQGSIRRGYTAVVETFDEQHSLECWTAEFGQLQPLQNVLFTGGDDATIIAHDTRTRGSIWSNSKIHEAGVVAIKCSTQNFRSSYPTSLITGSYDDHIRSFDLRMIPGDTPTLYPGRNIPVTQLSSLNLGGGVWRFSEMPVVNKLNLQNDHTEKLLVCCVYDGAKIVALDQRNTGTDSFFTVEGYLKTGHDSICYGNDWGTDFIATCSFYDKSLQLW